MDNPKASIENKGEIKGHVSNDVTVNVDYVLSKRDRDLAYVYKKTEKIATAIFALTSYLDESDTMRAKLRTNIFEILSLSLKQLSVSSVGRAAYSEAFIVNILEEISLIKISRFSNIISVMNCDVIISELDQLLNIVSKSNDNNGQYSNGLITRDFFNTPFEVSKNVLVNSDEKNNTRTSAPSHSTVRIPEEGKEVSVGRSAPKIIIKDNKTSMSDRMTNRPTASKLDRSTQILSLLKNDTPLTIKDFASVIQDCSEKTIQRELISLVSKGVIRKEGERRWSKYYLK